MIKYPMAGEKSHHVTIGVYNVTTEKTIWLKTGEPNEQYLTNIAWSPDNKKIYVVILNREQNHLKFNRYDAASGDFEIPLKKKMTNTFNHCIRLFSLKTEVNSSAKQKRWL